MTQQYLTPCPPPPRSVEELFPLIEFCKNGDLKAVSDWIAKGNPLELPPAKETRRASPLQIAIGKGFLTLTETLLDGGADPASSGKLEAAQQIANHESPRTTKLYDRRARRDFARRD